MSKTYVVQQLRVPLSTAVSWFLGGWYDIITYFEVFYILLYGCEIQKIHAAVESAYRRWLEVRRLCLSTWYVLQSSNILLLPSSSSTTKQGEWRQTDWRGTQQQRRTGEERERECNINQPTAANRHRLVLDDIILCNMPFETKAITYMPVQRKSMYSVFCYVWYSNYMLRGVTAMMVCVCMYVCVCTCVCIHDVCVSDCVCATGAFAPCPSKKGQLTRSLPLSRQT